MKKVYLIATVVAIIAGIATYLFATQIQQKTKIENAPTTAVVVAIAAIPENTTVTAEMVALRQLTVDAVTPGAAQKLEDVIGKLSIYPIIDGEQIILSQLNDKENSAALSYQLKEGEYAYTVSVDIVSGVGGFISKGDYVDILFTTAVNDVITTTSFLKDIKVLRIADYAANYSAKSDGSAPITSYPIVTLSLNEVQIIDLTQALSTGRITLALKTIASGSEESTLQAETTQVPVETTIAA